MKAVCTSFVTNFVMLWSTDIYILYIYEFGAVSFWITGRSPPKDALCGDSRRELL